MTNFLKNPLFNKQGNLRPPIWFMRQAGRYHQHYQKLKAQYDFWTLCTNPDLATEVTLGPIEEFGFDGAILFSDLLFPLDLLGMGLHYNDGPPKLTIHLDHLSALSLLNVEKLPQDYFQFQKKALQNLTKKLPSQTTLLGFVGAPFTLFTYACQGSHQGNLTPTKKGLYDGRFEEFLKILLPILEVNIQMQHEGGAEIIYLFDTAVGELCLGDFDEFILPVLEKLSKSLTQKYPNLTLGYFSKNTSLTYLKKLRSTAFTLLGIDWRVSIKEALDNLSDQFYIQGNLDPSHLHLSWNDLEKNLIKYKNSLPKESSLLKKLIINLGHGVLPQTPEKNVFQTVQWLKENIFFN